jgi:hypothetical protein
MLNMNFDIAFRTEGKIFKLLLLASCTIVKNVEALADTAEIVLPEAVLNDVLNIADKVKRGSEVIIKLGYGPEPRTEFVGYVQEVQTNGSVLKIVCEDELFQFRKKVADMEFNNSATPEILRYLIGQTGSGVQLVTDYSITYEKFTIYQATAYDVLKKIAEETNANIYFQNNELHMRSPFTEKGGSVIYDLFQNVESSSLEYKPAIDRKVEVTIESTSENGTVKTIKMGQAGGESISRKVGGLSNEDIQKTAEAVLAQYRADRYEGNITSWLVPVVEPTYTAEIRDADYPEKNGKYYVKAVTTEFSDAGGKRTVELGVKLG